MRACVHLYIYIYGREVLYILAILKVSRLAERESLLYVSVYVSRPVVRYKGVVSLR